MSGLISSILNSRDQFLDSRLFGKYGNQVEIILFGLIGLGLAVPFIEQAIPINIPILVFTLVPIALYLLLFSSVDDYLRVLRPGLFTLVLVFPLGVYFIAAVNSNVSLFSSIWIAFFYGCFYLILIILLTVFFDSQRAYVPISKFFSASVSVGAVVAAFAGLYKFLVFRNGVVLDFVSKVSPERYPSGTSLLNDYNFFSLTLLLGALFLIRYCTETKSSKYAFLLAFCCTVVIVAGIYSWSRRFIILAPLLLPLAAGFRLYSSRSMEGAVRPLAIIAGVVAALVIMVIVLDVSGGLYDRGLSVRVATFATDDHGASPRLERWQYACELISKSNIWHINDFHYREEYGCKFVSCLHDDYPHSMALSAIHYGGIAGFLSVIILYIYILYLLFKLVKSLSANLEIALTLVSVVLYTAISGDTMFSMPVLLVSLIIAKMAVEAERKNKPSIQ